MSDLMGKFCKPLLNGLCNEKLAFGNLQLDHYNKGFAISEKFSFQKRPFLK